MTTARPFISAMQVTLDGFILGPEGESDWVDELRLIVHPVAVGHGTPLFGAIPRRQELDLIAAEPAKSGHLELTYRPRPGDGLGRGRATGSAVTGDRDRQRRQSRRRRQG